MKRLILCLCLFWTSAAVAQIPFSLEPETSKSSLSFGFANLDSRDSVKASYSDTYFYEGLTVEPVLQLLLPVTSGAAHGSFFIKKASYETEWGSVKWGRQKQVTMGQGLLMSNYDSGFGGPTTELTPDKMAAIASTTTEWSKVEAMVTARGLLAGRGSLTFSDTPLGTPIAIGLTAVRESSGVAGNFGQSGMAYDIAFPVGGEFLTGYIEYSELAQHGNATGLGVRGDFFGFLFYKAELRELNNGFVPAYFGKTYELTPNALSSDTKNQGGIFALGGTLNDGTKIGVQYERYGELDALTLSSSFTPVAHLQTTINYIRPLPSGSTPVLDLSLHYKPDGPISWYCDYKVSDFGGINNRFYGAGMVYYFPQ